MTSLVSTGASRSTSVHRRCGRELIGIGTVVLALHLVGVGLLWAWAATSHRGTTSMIGLGTGLLAYSLGMRHAFDVDHIAAIDNATRSLLRRGRPPYSTGFFFSLGHSSVVLAMTVLLCLGVRRFAGSLRDPHSTLHQWTGVVGPAVSSAFLLAIGLINVGVLLQVARVFRDLRTGRYDDGGFDELLAGRGLLNRLLGGMLRGIGSSWRLYPLGVLFGLGFDTATEIGLLVLTATTGGAVPMWAALSLPVLFAAGMCLFDSLDGVLMTRAYSWAFVRPVRKVYYNLATTALSVFVALFTGSYLLLRLAGQVLGLAGGPWRWAASLDLEWAGYAVAAAFGLTWVVALVWWRLGDIERRWSAPAAE